MRHANQSKYAANLENYKRNTGHDNPLAMDSGKSQGSNETEVQFVDHKDGSSQAQNSQTPEK